MHLLRTMSWQCWKKNTGGGGREFCTIMDNVTFASSPSGLFFSLLIAQMSLLCNSDTNPVQRKQGFT